MSDEEPREWRAHGLRHVEFADNGLGMGPHVQYEPEGPFVVDGVRYQRSGHWLGLMICYRPEESEGLRGAWSCRPPCPTSALLGGHLRPHP